MWPFRRKKRMIFDIPNNIPVIRQVIDPDRDFNILLVSSEDFDYYENIPQYTEFGCIIGDKIFMSKKSKCKRVIFR